jgi:hypothetical protein
MSTATFAEVLQYLIPNGGYLTSGDEYSGITFLECDPITEQEFLDGFAKVDAAKKAAETKRNTDRQALLTKLGITADEAALLLS